jgi:hypothetical protein
LTPFRRESETPSVEKIAQAASAFTLHNRHSPST